MSLNLWAEILSRDLKCYLNNTFDYNSEKIAFIKLLINKGKNILNITLKECEEFHNKVEKDNKRS